jgi:hypothetical protein
MTRRAPAAAHRATACSIVGSASSMCATSTNCLPVTCLQGSVGCIWLAVEQQQSASRGSGAQRRQATVTCERRCVAHAPASKLLQCLQSHGPGPSKQCDTAWNRQDTNAATAHLYKSTNSKSDSFASALREP